MRQLVLNRNYFRKRCRKRLREYGPYIFGSEEAECVICTTIVKTDLLV